MKNDLPIGMMDQPSQVIARYRRMVAAGESPRLAEMFAVRKAPKLETDTAHYAGMPALEETAGFEYAKKVKQQARAAGISITDSSIYNGTIADERGGADPNAWLLAGDGRDKFRKVIRDKGKACESLGVEADGSFEEKWAKKEKAFNKRQSAKKERQAEMAEKATK